MDLERAERQLRQLRAALDRGALDDAEYRVHVAKLMFRDSQGTFWMLDPDDGTWYRNSGNAWETGDPRAEAAAAPAPPRTTRPRRRRLVALGVALIALLALSAVYALQRWPAEVAPPATPAVQVSIASPGDGSQVPVGREVAVESTLNAPEGLDSVDRVELLVGGQTVDTQSVGSRVQPGQTSLPVSQHWIPADVGERQVVVRVLAAGDESLGETAITLLVAEASDEQPAEPACSPDAAFVADVTIAPGTAFQPGAQMDKVWQVRNSGTCAWGVGHQLIRVEGEALGAEDSVSVPPTAAGATADLAVTFQAPSEAGTYTSTWRLHTPDGVPFGPALALSIEVEAEAEANLPPEAPTGLEATITEDGTAIQLTWQDQSANEDAFRVYRNDTEASIGLVPANARLFVDRTVACGNTYRYRVVAFNAAGASSSEETAEVTVPPCTPAGQ